MRQIRFLALAAVVVAAAGCDLDVVNLDNPDRPRILASPAEVEALGSVQFQGIISATVGNFNSVNSMMAVASFMNASGLANTGMGPKSSIPRAGIDNSVGNSESAENYRDFRILSGVVRNATDILIQMGAEDRAVPYLGPGRAADDRRLRALAYLVGGVAYGYISMVYDASGISRPDDAEGFIPPLSDYAEVNAYALEMLDNAIRLASGMPAMPATWITGPGASGTIAEAEFIRIARSYRAHIRADVARNPQERADVVNGSWADIVADAQAGIQADLIFHMDPNDGWNYDWLNTAYHFRDANWHQMTYYIIGMADVSGGYADWLAAPRDTRPYFTIVTPDLRFPQGATRDEQITGVEPLDPPQYYRNRPLDGDEGTTGWRNSQYDHWRFRGFADNLRIGPFPWFTRAQNDMLQAEGLIRTGQAAAALPLINRTRAIAGLPAATVDGVTGAACVPRFPPGAGTLPGLGALTHANGCGTLALAMMWEQWNETAWTKYGSWFFVNRGWGVLPVGTAVHWPVPHQELDARQEPIYGTGGAGLPGGAAPSVFGFGEGIR
jgi:hypothetical protein